MQSLLIQIGGRPFAYDDVEILQGLALAGTHLLANLPNCVVSGCQLTASGSTYDVASGVLWLDGELRDFPGRTGVTLPALFQAGVEVKSDNRVHTLSGLNLPCVREQNVELVDYDPTNPPSRRPLLLTANGPLMWWHRMQEKTRSPKELQPLAGVVLANYDGTGKGIGAGWGWALCNGQNGTIDLRGQFTAGFDPARAEYDMPGKRGGADTVTLTTPQLPAHAHGTTLYHEGNDGSRLYGSFVGQQNGAQAGSVPGAVDSTGGGQPHENRPSFTTIGYQQWIGYE